MGNVQRYFQHLNYNDNLFGEVTTLQYIDDSDPSLVLYYFADGSKCNKAFIANVNDMNAFEHMEFAELSSPDNKWQFAEDHMENDVKTREYDSVQYVAADPYAADSNPYSRSNKTHYKVIAKPLPVRMTQPQQDSQHYRAEQQNNVQQPQFYQQPTQQYQLNPAPQQRPVSSIDGFPVNTNNSTTATTGIGNIDVEYMLSKQKIQFVYNGKSYIMDPTEFFNNAITPFEQKITYVTQTKQEVSDDHIEISLDDTQKALIDNMINMSQKETCDIEMAMTLSLPPISVYSLLKQVYSEDMAKGFVRIIADRLKVKELKYAVANGLIGYYDEDYAKNSAVEIIEEQIKAQNIKSDMHQAETNIVIDEYNDAQLVQNVDDVQFTVDEEEVIPEVKPKPKKTSTTKKSTTRKKKA